MILSSRPTDRRQLIEEAAGVTKYKARRRSAELKLEAAQQNLTRIDDIVFEVEKQRGTLKRQAGKARRYQKLRDELRRWEKVLFARKYRQLAETIESARARLADARERESAAAARVAEVEADLGRLRIELVEAESRATDGARGGARARARDQPPAAADRVRPRADRRRSRRATASVAAELDGARGAARAGARRAGGAARAPPPRRTPSAIARRRRWRPNRRRTRRRTARSKGSRPTSKRRAARCFRRSIRRPRCGTRSSTRRRRASASPRRCRSCRSRRRRADRVRARRRPIARAAADGLRRAHEAIEATRIARAARESELASARIEHEWRARSVRAREHELAGLEARLKSLEELEAARADYGDAARTVLAQANGKVDQQGAIADYLEVEAGYERAVEACLGDLLQHVVVERPEHAAAGFQLVREQRRRPLRVPRDVGGAGRRPPRPRLDQRRRRGLARAALTSNGPLPDGFVALSSVVRVNGPFADAIRRAIGDAWIAAVVRRRGRGQPR